MRPNPIGASEEAAVVGLSEAENRSRRGTARALSIRTNAAALLLNIVLGAGLGYVSWLLVARLADPRTVGLAAAVVSAGLLCANLAVLGLGTTTITFLPAQLRDPAPLLNGFVTIVALAGALAALGFAALAVVALGQLDVLGSDPLLTASFVALSSVTTVLLLLDGVSTALRRADHAAVRAFLAGAAKLGVLVLAWVAFSISATMVVVAWFLSTLAVCLVGYVQVRKVLPGYRYRPRVAWTWVRVALTNGLSNHVLNLARLAPSMVFPLIVTELISARANAFWYAAWMIAFVVAFIPAAAGQATFAAVTNGTITVSRALSRGVSRSLLAGAVPIAGLILLADPILQVMGSEYAAEGARPLRLLALAVIPQFFTQFYIVVRRVQMKLAEANAVFLCAGVLEIAAAYVGARGHGLVGVAVAWLVLESAVGAWAAIRVVQAARSEPRDGR